MNPERCLQYVPMAPTGDLSFGSCHFAVVSGRKPDGFRIRTELEARLYLHVNGINGKGKVRPRTGLESPEGSGGM
jgi:hypothetical protein